MALTVVPFRKSRMPRSSGVNVIGVEARLADCTSIVLCSAGTASPAVVLTPIAALISFTCSRSSSTSDCNCCTCCCSNWVESCDCAAGMLLTLACWPDMGRTPSKFTNAPTRNLLLQLRPNPAKAISYPLCGRHRSRRFDTNCTQHRTSSVGDCALEHNHDGHIQRVLCFDQIRRKSRNNGAGRTGVASRRGYASWSCEIGDVCRAMVVLKPEGNVLAGHVVERS